MQRNRADNTERADEIHRARKDGNLIKTGRGDKQTKERQPKEEPAKTRRNLNQKSTAQTRRSENAPRTRKGKRTRAKPEVKSRGKEEWEKGKQDAQCEEMQGSTREVRREEGARTAERGSAKPEETQRQSAQSRQRRANKQPQSAKPYYVKIHRKKTVENKEECAEIN